MGILRFFKKSKKVKPRARNKMPFLLSKKSDVSRGKSRRASFVQKVGAFRIFGIWTKDIVSLPSNPLFLIVVGLTVFGVIMIADASMFQANEFFGDKIRFVKYQLLWLSLGFVGLLFSYLVNYRALEKLALPTAICAIGSLVAVLAFADRTYGSKRWVAVGGFHVQPSEFAKIAVIIYLAKWLDKDVSDVGRKSSDISVAFKKYVKTRLLSFLIIVGTICGLILAEPDLGMTITVAGIAFGMYFLSSSDTVHFLGMGLLSLVGLILGLIAGYLEAYRVNRIKTYIHLLTTGEVLDPKGQGYQLQQVLLGIGSGGLLGKGFGQSRQRFGYLVENTAFTDSIFAVILEELGLVGGMIMLVVFWAILVTGYNTAVNAKDKFGKYLATGITVWFTLQALFHMATNVGAVPITGISMPFVSYGGSSTIATLVAAGLLLNVGKRK